MKRFLSLLAILMLGCWSSPAQDKVYPNVTTYFEQALTALSVEEIIGKVDQLIATGDTPERQAQIAGLAFDYYSNAPIMGQEAVAVHVADNYFLNHKLQWSDPETLPLVYTFAAFNRSTLIGCDAPELTMESLTGESKSVRADGAHYKLLYFYSTQCATCREYTREIAEMGRSYTGGRISIFAINTGSDRAEWEKYVSGNFSDMTAWKVNFFNLWDPEDSSNYHMKYGVIQTPCILVLDSQNKVIGRRLDPASAKSLLGQFNFADRQTKKLIREVCKALSPIDTAVAEQIGSTLKTKMASDSLVYRDTFYELFNFLRDHPNYVYQQSAALIAERYIVGEKEYFSSEYIDKVNHALDVFKMNPIGSKAPDLMLEDSAGVKKMMLGKRSQRAKNTLVIFHITGCPDCAREFRRLDSLRNDYAAKGLRIVCVYAARDEAAWKKFISTHDPRWVYLRDKDNTSGMREKYDIDFVPKIYLINKKGIITAKEIDALDLEEIILKNKR